VSYKVVSTRVFEKELKRLAKKYKSLKEDITALSEDLEATPAQGTPLGGSCY
jgi:mRNA-degrading endonuclease RelE of RelBE toxin-antitoxin system